MRLNDQEYTRCPCCGSRRVTVWLAQQGLGVSRKRARRLMRLIGLAVIYPKPKLPLLDRSHKVPPGYPLAGRMLRGVAIERVDQVWINDITYVPMASGFMYPAAVIDWHSRYVISWRLSNTPDGSFCQEMLDETLGRGRPEVFNADQGVQFAAEAFTSRLLAIQVAVSMDGKGRCLDNVFVERP